MKLNLKKMWPTAVASLVVFTSLLQADDNMQMRNLENRVTALEQRKGANGVINPSANPPTRDASGLFFTAEALYWKAHENGLDYAIESDTGVAGFPIQGSVRHPKTRFDWGSRIGLGYAMPHDGWDLYADWTWFRSKKRDCDDDCDDCCSQCGTELFYPEYTTLCDAVTCPNVTDACGQWKMTLNMLDVELGRDFFVSKWLTLRPFMGGRGAWIGQNYGVEYAGGTYATGETYDISMKCNFAGGGVRGGLDTQWYFARDWSFYGEFALSALWGNFNVKTYEVNATTGALRENIRNKYQTCRAITDLKFGVAWDHGFDDDALHFGINVGWEHHFFFGMNQFMKTMDPAQSAALVSNQGDLTLKGWVFGARLDF